MSPRPRSIPPLYSLSGPSSLTSIISIPTNPSISGSISRSLSPSSEFIFPIHFSGDSSEISPLLRPHHRSSCNGFKACTCIHPNHTARIRKNCSSNQSSSIRSRYYSIQRSSFLNLQIISGVLFIFCLAIVVLSPFSNHTENGTPTPERGFKSTDDYSPLTALHGAGASNPKNLPIQTQTQTRTHKLDTPQLKGIEFAILCFAIFVICSIIRAASYAMSRWEFCFGGEGSDSNEGVFGDKEKMMRYGGRRGEVLDNMV